jgi:hypothetical protein
VATVRDKTSWNKRPVHRGDVHDAIAKLAKIAVKLGVKEEAEEWALVVGSQKYKKPWILKRVTPTGAEVPVRFLPQGYLGETVTQAHQKLVVLQTAWQYVLDKQEA